MSKYYLLTISHVRVKESPTEDELIGVLWHLRDGLFGKLSITEWVFEVGPKYQRKHVHAIAILEGRYSGFTSYIVNDKLFQIRWDLLRKPVDVRKARLYIRKDDPDIHIG